VTRRDAAAALTLPVGKRDHIRGPADAAVTLVEYGDYECPHCGRAYPIVKTIQKQMGPKLRFVFRNFPLRESHPMPSRRRRLPRRRPRRASSGRCTTACSNGSLRWTASI